MSEILHVLDGKAMTRHRQVGQKVRIHEIFLVAMTIAEDKGLQFLQIRNKY